jgi:hypothetical protein
LTLKFNGNRTGVAQTYNGGRPVGLRYELARPPGGEVKLFFDVPWGSTRFALTVITFPAQIAVDIR